LKNVPASDLGGVAPAAPFDRLRASFETHSLPTFTRCYPSQLYLDRSHCPVLALPSTHAIPNRDVFYVANPIAPFAAGADLADPAPEDRAGHYDL
jgi:hypothetical protein